MLKSLVTLIKYQLWGRESQNATSLRIFKEIYQNTTKTKEKLAISGFLIYSSFSMNIAKVI
jgi:hypothetical protein